MKKDYMGVSLPVLANEIDAREFGWNLMVERFGPECATWLIRTYRKKMRSFSGATFHVRHAEMDEVKLRRIGILIAFDFLAKRKNWDVQTSEDHDKKTWTITWNPHGLRANA